MKKIEMDYYESFEYEEYSLEEIEKLEAAGAFNDENLELEIALDELQELRGDDILF